MSKYFITVRKLIRLTNCLADCENIYSLLYDKPTIFYSFLLLNQPEFVLHKVAEVAMYNNTTAYLKYSNTCSLENDEQNHSSSPYVTIAWSASIAVAIVAILSPVAAAGNALVLAAIWRNQSLRTPSYVLLAGLAFTDFCTGLITQPVYVAM